MVDLELKLNNGQGALLCECRYILAYGWDHLGKTYTCGDCGKTWLVKPEYFSEDKTVYGHQGELVENSSNRLRGQ